MTATEINSYKNKKEVFVESWLLKRTIYHVTIENSFADEKFRHKKLWNFVLCFRKINLLRRGFKNFVFSFNQSPVINLNSIVLGIERNGVVKCWWSKALNCAVFSGTTMFIYCVVFVRQFCCEIHIKEYDDCWVLAAKALNSLKKVFFMVEFFD